MADIKEQYKAMLTECIQKHMVIFGPNMAVHKARKVQGLSVLNDGMVSNISGDGELVLRNLAREYSTMSPTIVTNVLSGMLAKYPDIKPLS